EHRRRRAPVQQLRRHRPRRHGAGGEDSRDRARRAGRHHRPVRPDHAVARRDVPRGGRDGAPGLRPAAAHRRRHHPPPPHPRVHPAVQIHPNYRRGQTVYVTDASRAVGVTSALMSPATRETYYSEVRGEYAKIAAAHARSQEEKHRLSLADARANALKLDWSGAYAPPRPAFTGLKVFDDYSIA